MAAGAREQAMARSPAHAPLGVGWGSRAAGHCARPPCRRRRRCGPVCAGSSNLVPPDCEDWGPLASSRFRPAGCAEPASCTSRSSLPPSPRFKPQAGEGRLRSPVPIGLTWCRPPRQRERAGE